MAENTTKKAIRKVGRRPNAEIKTARAEIMARFYNGESVRAIWLDMQEKGIMPIAYNSFTLTVKKWKMQDEAGALNALADAEGGAIPETEIITVDATSTPAQDRTPLRNPPAIGLPCISIRGRVEWLRHPDHEPGHMVARLTADMIIEAAPMTPITTPRPHHQHPNPGYRTDEEQRIETILAIARLLTAMHTMAENWTPRPALILAIPVSTTRRPYRTPGPLAPGLEAIAIGGAEAPEPKPKKKRGRKARATA